MRPARRTARTAQLLTFTLLLLAIPLGSAEGSDTSAGPAWTFGGRDCSLIPLTAPSSETHPPEGCPGVRPGAGVWTDLGGCSLNFLFSGFWRDEHGKKVEAGTLAGTAGHCILGQHNERSWYEGKGPTARDDNGERIGEFAYAILNDAKDFALIRLDPGVEASPSMCHWGGPTGIDNEETAQLKALYHFGQGEVLGDVQPARAALAFGTPHHDHVYAEGLAVPGDAGSGIISADGRALGVIVGTGVYSGRSATTWSLDAGTLAITRLGVQVKRAEAYLGMDLELLTAPFDPIR
ncbi:MAG: hypothetical protein ACRDH9_11910 [Actinomycetota bacterium]